MYDATYMETIRAMAKKIIFMVRIWLLGKNVSPAAVQMPRSAMAPDNRPVELVSIVVIIRGNRFIYTINIFPCREMVYKFTFSPELRCTFLK